MTSRAIASSNQWRESTGAVVTLGRVIDHSDHSGFVTFDDSGTVSAFMVDDPAHSGFTTPDDAAGAGDSVLLIIGGGFATPV